MQLKKEEIELINQEESIVKTTIDSLLKQRQNDLSMLSGENQRARFLTSEIHKTRLAEDKALLASDEAVAHALSHKKTNDIKVLAKLIEKPYFARFEVEEEINGAQKRLEYKLGFHANSDCRILDWRKAPISKLYYEYREGDEYFEEIQGKEREGTIAFRNSVDIDKRKLKRLTCSQGSFNLQGDNWVKAVSSQATHHEQGGLPHILSLITPEQFKLITDELEAPLLIQGVAGSGKTTVALHRLAYLLHEDNADITSEQVLVLVINPTLKSYISTTLPSIEVEGVSVLTLEEWFSKNIAHFFPQFADSEKRLAISLSAAPLGIERALHSMTILKRLEKTTQDSDLLHTINALFQNPRELIEADESRLLSLELMNAAADYLLSNLRAGSVPTAALPLLMRLIQLKFKEVLLPNGQTGSLKYVVADEVQDFSPLELASIVAAVKHPKDVLLVGDSAQNIKEQHKFIGWEKLRAHWGFKDSISKFITLEVSHRSTVQIMNLADCIQGGKVQRKGRAGRVPIWFKLQSESSALSRAITWLNEACKRYPDALTAVVCHTAEEAKELFKLLRPTFGAALRLGVDDSFTFEQGIVVSEVKRVRGLEFINVLLWDPSDKKYQVDERGRNQLYVAITRASENLCIVTKGAASKLLPLEASGLVRIYTED